MNEFLRNFVMTTILKMIDSNVAEWEVRQTALGWYTKGVLTETNLQAIDEKYKEEEKLEEMSEESVEENVESEAN